METRTAERSAFFRIFIRAHFGVATVRSWPDEPTNAIPGDIPLLSTGSGMNAGTFISQYLADGGMRVLGGCRVVVQESKLRVSDCHVR